MKLRWKLAIALPSALLATSAICWFTSDYCRFWIWAAYQSIRPVPTRCKERAAEFDANVKRVKADAQISLMPGTKKADAARFFASEKIPMDFYHLAGRNGVSGQIYIKGLSECSSVACGDEVSVPGGFRMISALAPPSTNPPGVLHTCPN